MSRDYIPADERMATALERIADAMEAHTSAPHAAMEARTSAARAGMVEAIARARFERWEYEEELWPEIFAREAPQIELDLAVLEAAGFLAGSTPDSDRR